MRNAKTGREEMGDKGEIMEKIQGIEVLFGEEKRGVFFVEERSFIAKL